MKITLLTSKAQKKLIKRNKDLLDMLGGSKTVEMDCTLSGKMFFSNDGETAKVFKPDEMLVNLDKITGAVPVEEEPKLLEANRQESFDEWLEEVSREMASSRRGRK
jgi:hypothetical protein